MADPGAEYTDDIIKEMEKRLRKEYQQAAEEVSGKLDSYLKGFAARDDVMRGKLAKGDITAEEYQAFRVRQMMMGKRWTDLQQTLAEDLHNVNGIAQSTVRGYMPDVYAVNHNWGTFEVERLSGVDTSYTLYDRQTVERLMRDDPDMLPPPGRKASARIAAGQDVLWNKQQIQSVMTQGILQGKSIPELASALEEVTERNYHAAVRNARTMATGAQNAGRVDSYKRAEGMGIKLKQRWIATLDNRTRHEHRVLHGQTVSVGEPFKVEGLSIEFPGDPHAEPKLVYNCRCTLVSVLEGHDRGLPTESPKMTQEFEAWQNEKSKKKPEPFSSERLKKAMGETEYEAFRKKIEGSENRGLYDAYADDVNIGISRSGGWYRPSTKTIEASYDLNGGRDRYSVIAHEYGHAFDDLAGRVEGLGYKEIDTITKALTEDTIIRPEYLGRVTTIVATPSTSDEFLGALRTDMAALQPKMTELSTAWRASDLNNATSGIQDALDGFYRARTEGTVSWGHGDRYYNGDYTRLIKGFGVKQEFRDALTDLGLPVKTERDARMISRQYRAASEAWANVSSAVTVGGPELEAMEKYMPNTVAQYRRIVKMIGGDNE